MDLIKLTKFSFVFLIGILLGTVLNFCLTYGMENPFLNGLGVTNNMSSNGPFDFVKENQIEIYPDRIVIKVENASVSRYAPSGSMIPVLNDKSNGIRIKPKSESEIHIGDIITFERDGLLIVHRVIEKGSDEKGNYFITKGDNNGVSDGKVRFSDIKYITIGIIW